MDKASQIRSVETLACDAGWRNYHFVKIVTEDGIVGWSEYDEGFGAPGVTAAIERLSARVVGKDAFQHERIYAELFSATRPAAGGVVALAIGAIENALLDVMFELPSRKDVSKCVITKETILKGLKPTLVTSAGADDDELDELAAGESA